MEYTVDLDLRGVDITAVEVAAAGLMAAERVEAAGERGARRDIRGALRALRLEHDGGPRLVMSVSFGDGPSAKATEVVAALNELLDEHGTVEATRLVRTAVN